MAMPLTLFLKLREASKLLKEHFPKFQVVVVGPQKSGKSAVIECLLGQFFIPRDNGISCPLKIDVKYNKNNMDHFIFQDCSHLKLTDLKSVEKEIAQRSFPNEDSNYGISLKPICLELYCHKSFDMTFIELPRIEVMDNNFLELENMFKSYLSLENTIILVVWPASQYVEFRNSKLLKLVENNKNQTIVIFTYLDFCKTDLHNFFENFSPDNFLHVAGVYCGIDKHLKRKKKIEDFHTMERRFFEMKNLPYGNLHGIKKILQILSQYVEQRLLTTLPNYLYSLNMAINLVKKELTLSKEEKLDADKIILEEITLYVNHFNSLLSGKNIDIETKTLVGGARISYIFREHFATDLDDLNPLAGLSRPNILAAVRNTCGTRPEVLFLSEDCFEILARRQVSQLKDPCYHCVELVYEEMMKLKTDCSNCLKSEIFPKLSEALIKTTAELIDTRFKLCSELINELLNMELAFISTVDSDFEKNVDFNIATWIFTQNPLQLSDDQPKVEESDPRLLNFGGSNWLSNFFSSKFSEKVYLDIAAHSKSSPTFDNVKLLCISSKENADCQLLENLVAAYFSTVRRSLKDSVPKAIMLRMVNFVRDNLYNTLLERLQQEKHLVADFTNSISKKRKDKILYLQELCECKKSLEEIKET